MQRRKSELFRTCLAKLKFLAVPKRCIIDMMETRTIEEQLKLELCKNLKAWFPYDLKESATSAITIGDQSALRRRHMETLFFSASAMI